MSQFDALYERGIAVGQSDIKNDVVNFVFRDEKYSFPTLKVYGFLEDTHMGFYWAPIDKLRELEREAASG
jgi:hypothetical protein